MAYKFCTSKDLNNEKVHEISVEVFSMLFRYM